jgi:adenylate cyclase
MIPLFWAICTLSLALIDWGSTLLIDKYFLRNRTFGHIVVLKGLTLVLAVLLLTLATRLMAAAAGQIEWSDLLPNLLRKLREVRFTVAVVYAGCLGALSAFIRQVALMVGPRVLIDLIRGRYFHPKEEERIFAFLDLKGSTMHAERLGHATFSRLIQDCFRDLTDAAIQHNVDIYKYVGDEAILTWHAADGLQDWNCVRACLAFQVTLTDRRAYYEATYGLLPEFKAGINMGHVTVAEVGVIKRGIEYMSDVLNTAARIEGKCNEYGCNLLVSGAVKDGLAPEEAFHVEHRGSVLLRGKEETVEIYGVLESRP